MKSRIFLSAPDVRDLERRYVLEAIESNWLAPAGPELVAFEEALCQWSGRTYAVAMSSGTAALHLALLGLGIKPGDEVFCSSLTFAGSANPIVYCGATPVFIDSEADSWNVDPDLLAVELEERSKTGNLPAAAIVVDLYGVCADYERIAPLLEHYDVPMIEDAAEALGGTYHSEPAGSFGHHAILSFNGNKIVTSSGGGAFVTDDPDAAARVRHLSTQARQPAPHYEHTEIGYNYRMSSLCAALGRAQLERLQDRIDRRAEIGRAYRTVLEPVDGIDVLTAPQGTTSNNWLTCATLDPARSPVSSAALIDCLEEENIESRPVWKPMHMQPVFAYAPRRTNGTSQRLFETGICLPTGSGMSDEDVGRVIRGICRSFD